jgi:uncharacterized GH25 family protein
MNPRLLFLLAMVVALVLCVGPVVGLRENFQDYADNGNLQYMHDNVANTISPAYNPIWVFGDNNGTVYINRSSDLLYPLSDRNHMSTGSPAIYTYSAFDVIWCSPTANYIQTDLIDTSFNDYALGATPPSSCVKDTRIEMKIIGGTPTTFKNGVQVATSAVVAVNPSYFAVTSGQSGVGRHPIGIDNLVIGEADRHIVGALPSNWSIQRDLLNPAATGVYAQHPITGAWAIKDSYYFYLDADKEYLLPENVVIKEYMTGTVVNTTTVSGTGNRIKYSISQFLNTPTSLGTTLPDGKYTVSFESSPLIYDDFWIISSGATMSFNKVQYSTGESAYITYTISPTYFTSDYTYKMEMQDVYGNVIESQALTSATGTKTFVTNPTSYPPGVYYGVIRATKLSDGSVSIMAYSGMETVAYILWNGYVMNAENGSVISGAYVNVTQLGTTLQSQSLATGAWNSSNNWIPSNQFNITTMKTGYTTDVRLLTPLGTTGINLNLSLVPLPPLNASTSIGGIVRDNVYGNPIPNATVSGVNNTLTRTNLTNIAGYYRVDNMKLPDVVNMSAAKIGYVNDTALGFLDASVATSFTRKDLILDPVFSFTLNIVDFATSMPIPVVGVLDSLGNNQTTTTGVYTASYPYSSVVLYLSSSGYDSKSVSYIIDSDRTETTTMTKSIAAGNKNTWYTMQLVRLKVVDAFGSPLPNATIRVNYLASTLPSTDISWLTAAFGVDATVASQMTNGSTAMTGTTTNDGSLTFMMFPALTYGVTITNPAIGLNNYRTIAPRDTDYVLYCPLSTQIARNNTIAAVASSSLPYYKLNTSYYNLSMIYYDASGYTTNLKFKVIDYTGGGTTVLDRNWGNPGTATVVDNYTVYVPMGQEYIWKYNATKV